jgi:hypothetical protein
MSEQGLCNLLNNDKGEFLYFWSVILKAVNNPKINFIASVMDDRIIDIEAIAKNLKDMGCTIDNVLAFSGVITGSASCGTSLSDLKIDGIKNIEQDREIKAIRRSPGIK